MMNSVTIVGRLTADVELRYTQNGKAVGNFMVASNRPFKNAQGEQEADFIRCQAWGKQAENLANYMKKGSMIGVTGRIQTGSYDDKDGKKVYTTDVVADNVAFLEPKSDKQNTNNNTGYENKQQQANQNQPQSNQNQSQGEPLDITDDMLPF